MSEQTIKCPCGCDGDTTYYKVLEHIFSILGSHLKGLQHHSMMLEKFSDEKNKNYSPHNSRIIIDSLCDDIKKISDRVKKIECSDILTENIKPEINICSDKDINPF
jgi:hypothetical protein